jgi:GT2 family glycosyltransferase
MTAGPQISVVVPVRNREDCLGDLFRELEGQTLPGEQFEVVIVDDASTDGTRDLAASWVAEAPARRRLIDGRGEGPASARNLGIAQAEAEWIAFTDSDTMPEADWLASGLDAVERHGVRALEGAVVPWPPEAVGTYTHQIDSGAGGRFMTANMIYHRDVLELVGGFDERFRAPFLEDSDLAFRVLDAGYEIPYAPEVRVRHRVERLSLTDALRSAQKLRWTALFAGKHPERYRTQLRPFVRPLSAIDVDVLLGLLAATAAPRTRGLPRLALALVAANGIRRGLVSAQAFSAPVGEMPTRATLGLSLPPTKAFWWLEGCIRFKRTVW